MRENSRFFQSWKGLDSCGARQFSNCWVPGKFMKSADSWGPIYCDPQRFEPVKTLSQSQFGVGIVTEPLPPPRAKDLKAWGNEIEAVGGLWCFSLRFGFLCIMMLIFSSFIFRSNSEPIRSNETGFLLKNLRNCCQGYWLVYCKDAVSCWQQTTQRRCLSF